MSQNSTNHIKIGSSTINSLSVGDFSIGVKNGADYGPTSDTGFYNGIVPPVGGYTIYVSKMSQGPSIHVPRTDEECLLYLNKYGANATNIADALTWAGNQTNLLVRTSEYQVSDLPNLSSFTIGTTDFVNFTTGGNVYASNVTGFGNNGGSNLVDDTYILYTASGNIVNDAATVANSVSMDYNTYAYAWNVTWADNSTGKVRLGIDTVGSGGYGQIIISPIDTTNTAWESGNAYGSSSKSGTFNFPATFTPYTPIVALGGHNAWC
jgi:hypothetical protein